MSRTSVVAVPMLLALVALTGCVSHRPVTTAEVTPRTELLLHFASPQAITLTSATGEAVAYDDVTEIQGRMIALNADSITLRATSVRRADGMQRLGPGITATFAVAGAQIQEVKRHPGRTIALVTFLALGLVLLIAVATYEEPPPPPPPEPKTKA